MEVDYPRVTHPFAGLLTLAGFLPRLACVRHAASVRSEPGSNSPIKTSHRSVSSCADVIPILLPIHSKHCGSAICFVDLLSSFQGPNLTATADDRLRIFDVPNLQGARHVTPRIRTVKTPA